MALVVMYILSYRGAMTHSSTTTTQTHHNLYCHNYDYHILYFSQPLLPITSTWLNLYLSQHILVSASTCHNLLLSQPLLVSTSTCLNLYLP
jgi:hypothetical protein